MLKVANALTGCKYDDNTFLIATSGRCEYHNKGIDLFLDAVARLGDLDPERRILAFVMVPAWSKDPRADLSNALRLDQCKRLQDPVITHNLNNPNDDAIYNRIRQIGFANDSKSQVSVIYVPCYLNGADGIFDLTYYDILPGLDATVFPSYYEPWGYTPLESVAFGVPTVTTSLSGFGQWVMSTFDNSFAACGVKVIHRGDFDYDQVKEHIAVDLKQLVDSTPVEPRRGVQGCPKHRQDGCVEPISSDTTSKHTTLLSTTNAHACSSEPERLNYAIATYSPYKI